MMTRLVSIFLILQAIGFAATWLHTRRMPTQAAVKIRGKFLVFFAITSGIFLSAYFRYPFILVAGAIVVAGLFEIARFHRANRRAYVVALPVYAVVGIGFLLFSLYSSVSIVVGTYAAITALDGFSQVSGQWLGRTRLAPRISPGKTVEGLAGGVAASALAYYALTNFSMNLGNIAALLIVLLAGFAGDILASAYKRQVGVKDFSDLIPYHGGVLDRFDSFMMAGFACYVCSLAGIALQT